MLFKIKIKIHGKNSNTLTLFTLLALTTALHIKLDFVNQQAWPGQCVTGHTQSPVNIAPTSNLCSDISFRISSPRTTISVPPYKDSNHHLLVPYTGSTLTTSNRQTNIQVAYKSVQFHFHIPSQHQLDGKSYKAQMHLFHATSQKKLAVFGVMIEVGQGNFADFLDGWEIGSPNQSQITLPEINTSSHVYHYQGSLTTPNSVEGVQWFVSSQTFKVKRSNFDKLKKVLNGGKISNRNVQNLNGRQLLNVGTGCIAARFGQK